MISAITNRGKKVRFIMYRDAMNSELLIKFMTRLTKDAGRKVFLILSNLRVHHSKNAKKGLEEHKEQIEVFYPSSYSPELIPWSFKKQMKGGEYRQQGTANSW